jgi:hypothetical protein
MTTESCQLLRTEIEERERDAESFEVASKMVMLASALSKALLLLQETQVAFPTAGCFKINKGVTIFSGGGGRWCHVRSVGISMSFGLALSVVVNQSLSGVCHPLSPCFIGNICLFCSKKGKFQR